MSIKHKVFIIILSFLFLFTCGCSETDDYLVTPTPVPTASPMIETPDLNTEISVIDADITSGNEIYSTPVRNNKLNCHAGYANILIEMSADIDNSIINYMYINDEPVDSADINISKNKIRMYLDDSLPYLYTLQIKSGYKIGDKEMTDDYTLDFLHEEALKYEISYYNFQLKDASPKTTRLTELDPTFKIKFNKPVDRDTLKFARSYLTTDPTTIWLSDSDVLITFNNLYIGRHTIGIESVNAQAEIYGNKLTAKSTYGENFNFDIIEKQHIYSVVPETNELKVITSLDYGSFFESISNDSKFITIGLINDYTDNLKYTRAFLNLNLKTITPFTSFISDSISDVTGLSKTVEDIGEYNPYISSDYWTNSNEYIYYYGKSIYSINPNSLEANVIYSNDKGKVLYPMIHLSNGNYAALSTPFNANDFMSLVVIDSSGNILLESSLPFKDYIRDGIRHFSPIMAEAKDGSPIVSGFDTTDDSRYAFKSIKINPKDGSYDILLKNQYFMQTFYDLDFGIHYKFETDSSNYTMTIQSFDGTVLKTHTIAQPFLRGFVFNPNKNVFYIAQTDLYNSSSSILIMDATTFEMTSSQLMFNSYIELIGITENGELLILD